MARPQKRRCICELPKVQGLTPAGCEITGAIALTYDEYEVIRLLDHLALTQQECARKMQISRPTVTRIYNDARKKMADVLVTGKSMTIGGGDVSICRKWKPECANEIHCCHRKKALSRGSRDEVLNGKE